MSFPHPGEYNIPSIPSSSRAQYYVLHSDGSYKYGYDTGDGAFEQAMKLESGDVGGYFGYTDADGNPFRIDYTAGVGGFVPVGAAVPDVSAAIPSQPAPAPVLKTSQISNIVSNSLDASAAVDADLPRGDASYSFQYETDGSSRSEQSDSDLNVSGKYSFVADDGIERTVDYKAGSATGFIATGAHLPVAPEAGAAAASVGAISPPVYYNQPNPAPVSPQVSASIKSSLDEPRGDASYSFSYQTDESSRNEISDADLNVEGRYSFVADDGVERTVDYKAGSATGFIATGDHLPVAPEVAPAAISAAIPSTKSAPSPALTYSQPSISTSSGSASIKSSLDEESRGDASYTFSYQTGESSRSESSDADLNVQGRFSFVADDGVERTVDYRAGSATGFVATGAHLPVAPEAGAAVASSGAALTKSAPAPSLSYSQPQPAAPVSSISASSASVKSSLDSEPRGDASYTFSYQTGDSSRSETSDADLNVEGKYSFVADDGVERTIDYVAGSSTGFVATGAHLPVAPEVAPAAAGAAGVNAALTKSAPSPSVSYGQPGPALSAVPASASIKSSLDEPRGDASYTFSYQTGESSRSETSDADLNIEGKFSFVADDGIERTVDYKAGSATGFVATGAHLPVAPEAAPAAAGAAGVSAILTKSAPSPSVSYGQPSPALSVGAAPAAASIKSSLDEPRGDASYSFSYQTDESSRSETSDADLNVEGKFSFVADDGIERTVDYKAGSATGFVASGAHLPVAPEASAAVAGAVLTKSAPSPALTYSQPQPAAHSSFSASSASVKSSLDEPRGDASYSFNYQNEDSSRNEASDSDLNVSGRFTFVADDGVERTVDYKAGSATGFVATGAHLPVAPEATGAVSSSSGSSGSSSFAQTRSSSLSSSSSSSSGSAVLKKTAQKSGGSTTQTFDNIVLHQYPSVNSEKFGYVFTAV